MGMSATMRTWVTKATSTTGVIGSGSRRGFRHPRRARNYVAAAALLLAVSLQTLPATATLDPVTALTPKKTEMFYALAAHPDDEVGSWTYLEQLPASTYIVSVLMTRGEGTVSCLPPEQSYNRPATDPLESTQTGMFLNHLTDRNYEGWEDSIGPYRYEGPNSPVGEPDRGERHPLGNPWVGQGTEACADARVASWHWFQDGSYRIDGIGTDLQIADDPELDDDYIGRFCPPGRDGSGRRWPSLKSIGCAQVWADERGARVVFDLGNATLVPPWPPFPDPLFTAEQVTAALQATRSNRSAWQIPVLPESGVFSHSVAAGGNKCPGGTPHPDHRVVQDAVRYTDQGLPVQAGQMACPDDSYAQGAEVRVVPANGASLVLRQLVDPVDGRRIGPSLVNYGWMWSEYNFLACPQPHLACSFWEVRNR